MEIKIRWGDYTSHEQRLSHIVEIIQLRARRLNSFDFGCPEKYRKMLKERASNFYISEPFWRETEDYSDGWENNIPDDEEVDFVVAINEETYRRHESMR